MLNLTTQHSKFVKKTALELGFSFVGIAKARQLDDEARRLKNGSIEIIKVR